MSVPVLLDISEVVSDFPGFAVALVVADSLKIESQRTAALDAFVREVENQVATDIAGIDLADIAELKRWRDAYKAFGVKKTSYRSSVERLMKSLQRGAGLPRVNALVDAYNAVSALYRMPVGADDLRRVTLPIAFRYARPTDTFVALGDPTASPDPPKPGEVVYADAEKCLCRRWNWYQDARSGIGLNTTCAIFTVQALAVDLSRLRKAAGHLGDMIVTHMQGHAAWNIAHVAKPQISVITP
jgi:DNA/RNA-binding domain of Phe-tRNA-synthetase-like protein